MKWRRSSTAWTKAWPSTAQLVKEATQRRFAVAAFKEAWFEVRIQPVPELWRAVIFGWNGVRTPYRTRRHVGGRGAHARDGERDAVPGPDDGARRKSAPKVSSASGWCPVLRGRVRSAFPAASAQAAFARVFALCAGGPTPQRSRSS